MILATQAAAEYAAIAMRSAATTLGRHTARAQAWAGDHFLVLVLCLLGVMVLLAFRSGSGRRR